MPTSFKEHGVKTWRHDGLHSNNINMLFKPASKGITWLERIQYLYIPAVKSNDLSLGAEHAVAENIRQTVNKTTNTFFIIFFLSVYSAN